MSLFRSSLRPPAVLSDEAVERYLAALRADIDPDPAFRRRLRGIVLNHYVAAREGNRAALVPRTMGRLGRAVLYASFVLAVSVTGVMAASEAAVPGDVLYPLKRAIEDTRVRVLPQRFHDELAVHELSERLSELATLVERGESAGVGALVTEVVASSASLHLLPSVDGPLDVRNQVFTELIARLPEPARNAIDRVMEESAFEAPTAPASSGSGMSDEHVLPSAPETGSSAGQDPDNVGAGRGREGGASSGTTGDGGSNAGNGGGPDDRRGRDDTNGAGRRPSETPGGGAIEEPSPTPKPKRDPAP